jgi:glycosyltransferase involved in cell wall biosynthesis
MSRAGPPRRTVLLGFDFYARYTVDLARGMLDVGWTPVLLRRDHDLEFGGVAGAQHAYLRRQVGPAVRDLALPGRVRSVHALPELRRLRRCVRDQRPSVVHLQDEVTNDPRVPILAGVRPGNYALTIHDPSVHPGDPQWPRHKRLAQRALVAGAGLVFVHAGALAEELRRHYRVRAPIVVVPHGAVMSPCASPGDPQTVLFFGRISYYKGLDVLLEAMELVWQQIPHARLVVAGDGAWPEHRALADPRVEVRRGHVPDDDVAGLFCRAGCVVLPYRQASQSGVGSLARRFGRALVVTEVGGLPELVTDATGRVVAPDSPRELAAALIALMLEPERLGAMGAAASGLLGDEATWTHVAAATVAAYERHLIGAPGRL